MEHYIYKATIERVIDGDTVQVLVDLGFKTYMSRKFRLVNVWAAERGEINFGLHTSYTKTLLPTGAEVMIKTIKDSADKYGRYLAEVFIDKKNINEAIQQLIGEKAGNI